MKRNQNFDYAQNTATFHLLTNAFQFDFADTKMDLLVTALRHRASPSLSK